MLPSGAALASLDRAVVAHYQRETREARALDGVALELVGRVQEAVSSLWPYALVSCFGSRATGLACATSDVDLVVSGVPGLDGFGAPPPSMGAQLEALEALVSRLHAVEGVTTAAINKSTVPVIALGAQLTIGGECWRHVPAEEGNVYSFSFWATQASAVEDPNPRLASPHVRACRC